MPVLIILAVLWAVVLVPPLLRSRSQRSADSIVDFNYTLDLLGRTNGNLEGSPDSIRGRHAHGASAVVRRGVALPSASRIRTTALPAMPRVRAPALGAPVGEAAARRAAGARPAHSRDAPGGRGRCRSRPGVGAADLRRRARWSRTCRCGRGRAACRPSASTRCATCRSCERRSSRSGAARPRSRGGGPARGDRRDRRPRPPRRSRRSTAPAR